MSATRNTLHAKHFTLEEARELLEDIRDRISDLTRLKGEVDALGYNLYRHQVFGGPGPNGEKTHPTEKQLLKILEELHTAGIVVKGIDSGLIDFPTIRDNGEEVYLCWMLGESTIEHWHRISDGYAGRRPISEL